MKVKVLVTAEKQRDKNPLNLNCSSYSSCFLSFCSCSRSKRERGSYSSSGASEKHTNKWMFAQLYVCQRFGAFWICEQMYVCLPSGSSGFLTFSHSSCLFFLFSSSSASDTNFLLRSTPAAPPPAITTAKHTTNMLFLSKAGQSLFLLDPYRLRGEEVCNIGCQWVSSGTPCRKCVDPIDLFFFCVIQANDNHQ